MTSGATPHEIDTNSAGLESEFRRELGLFDSTMVVVGSMIGSGIFIVSAEMSRLIGSPGWLLANDSPRAKYSNPRFALVSGSRMFSPPAKWNGIT